MWDCKLNAKEPSSLQAKWNVRVFAEIEAARQWARAWDWKSTYLRWKVWTSTTVLVISCARSKVVCDECSTKRATPKKVFRYHPLKWPRTKHWSNFWVLGLSCATSLAVDVHNVAECVCIPLNSLEGIWKKAAELLKTEGAIVPAPSVGDDEKICFKLQWT